MLRAQAAVVGTGTTAVLGVQEAPVVAERGEAALAVGTQVQQILAVAVVALVAAQQALMVVLEL